MPVIARMAAVVALTLPCAVVALALLSAAPREVGEPEGYATVSIEGFTVHVEEPLVDPADELGRETLALLRAKLLDVRRAVPERALARLRGVPIWVDRADTRFPCAVYHPSREWLAENGCDARKAKGVHLANAKRFLEWTREQPSMVLHELAHAWHDRLDAADRERVAAAHARALASKSWDAVLRWNGATEKHYALENPEEFFAEASEAWFGTNDFYPFVRAELVRHDEATAKLVEEIWSQ